METTTQEKIDIVQDIQQDIYTLTEQPSAAGFKFIEDCGEVELVFESTGYWACVKFMGISIWDTECNDVGFIDKHETEHESFEACIRQRIINLAHDLSKIARVLSATDDKRQEQLNLNEQ